MSALFAKPPKMPDAPAPPPTIDEAAQSQDYVDRLRRRRGRASTILVPDATAPAAGAKALLGQ